MRGPMYVEWEEPVEVTQPYPIVLIHGGRAETPGRADEP